AGPFKTRSRVLTLDPLEHFRYLRLQVKLGPVDPALVPRIRVFLRTQEDTAPAVIELTAQNPEVIWRRRFLPGDSDIRIFAETEWEDPRGDRHPLDDRAEIPGGTFVALGPYKGLLSIVVMPAANWTAATELRVELRYPDGDDLA